ncbi:BnaC01g27210D [Brassica napus]|uniref:BnaC01g27210D protein n=1 Tax=Brassica napus TaxID=3708 RepID=A0A078HNP4_BRANA|nr:BnaC01g27210D [Brassica napus]
METAFFSRFQESEALRKITDQICKGFRGKRLLSGSTRLPILTPTTRFPSSLVSLSNMDIVIKEASAKETTDVKQLNMLPEPVADTLPNGLRVPEFHLIHTSCDYKNGNSFLFSVSRIRSTKLFLIFLWKITDQICKGFRGKRLLSGSTRLPILTPTTRFPSSLVSISNMDIVIKEASAKETTDVKQLNLACKADGRVFIGNALIANCIEEEVSDQLRGLHGQATTAMLQLPEPVADTLPNGLRVPEFHLLRHHRVSALSCPPASHPTSASQPSCCSESVKLMKKKKPKSSSGVQSTPKTYSLGKAISVRSIFPDPSTSFSKVACDILLNMLADPVAQQYLGQNYLVTPPTDSPSKKIVIANIIANPSSQSTIEVSLEAKIQLKFVLPVSTDNANLTKEKTNDISVNTYAQVLKLSFC